MESKGILTIIGTGIRQSHLTTESITYIKSSDIVYYLVADKVTELFVKSIRPDAQSLQTSYAKGKERLNSYDEMVDKLVADVVDGKHVCAAFYGHPGVFVYPSHKAIRLVREKGLEANMLPSVSAEDCLFADIGFDPAIQGCVSYEASFFLLYQKLVDPQVSLILWQIGIIGEKTHNPDIDPSNGLMILSKYLMKYYKNDYQVCIYEASPFPICAPRIEWVALEKLSSTKVGTSSTLYVPPVKIERPTEKMLKMVGFSIEKQIP